MKDLKLLPLTELVTELKRLNAAYRDGKPFVSDDVYDHHYLEELRRRAPNHSFLHSVEPETIEGKIRHINPMLSTKKAYTVDDIRKFIHRVNGVARANNIKMVTYRITPKLDGMAANYENDVLATRGNGLLGNDITYNIDRGLSIKGEKNCGVGEIIIVQEYYLGYLQEHYPHPRNFVTGLISAGTLSAHAKTALKAGVIHFVPYSTLPSVECSGSLLAIDVERLCRDLQDDCMYLTDGAVIEVMDNELKHLMGSGSHNHHWQIAKKTKGTTALATVRKVVWQTGRTGRLTPVINVKPVKLSGAVISNVTGHHAGIIKSMNIGIDAVIEIIRSGEVIPALQSVVITGEPAIIPEQCPACKKKTIMRGDFLTCINKECKAQVESVLLHYFDILGNVDLFGPQTIKSLVDNGIKTLEQIYALSGEQLGQAGFSSLQGSNLLDQLKRSRTEPVEDWRFLAAFGIKMLGRGSCRKLLSKYSLEKVLSVTAAEIAEIDGFGGIKSKANVDGIKERKDTIMFLLNLGFNLIITSTKKVNSRSKLSGKNIVFTGKLSMMRSNMKEEALELGANVQSSVNGKTDYLIIGDNVGQKKITSASELGVNVLTEKAYRKLLEL